MTDKKVSADSNDALVKLFVVAAAVTDLHADLTEHGVELAWTVPERTSAGAPIEGIEEYRVYRGEIDPASAETVSKGLSHATWKSPLVQIASVRNSGYRDTAFDYGKTYVYVVRGALRGEGEELESSDSNSVVLTPKRHVPAGCAARCCGGGTSRTKRKNSRRSVLVDQRGTGRGGVSRLSKRTAG